MNNQTSIAPDAARFQPEEIEILRRSLTYQSYAMRFVLCLKEITKHMSWDLSEEVKQFAALEDIKRFGDLISLGRSWNSCFDFAFDLLEDLECIEKFADERLEDEVTDFLITFAQTHTLHVIKSMKIAVESLPEATELDAQNYYSVLYGRGYCKNNWQ